MTNIICGTLRKIKKFYFSFDVDKKILTIQPIKMNDHISFLSELDFCDFPYFKDYADLEGETNTHAYIKFINIKFSSIGRGCFKAWVPAYILGITNDIYPISKPNKINKLVFKGECIDRFSSSKSIVSSKWDRDNSKLQVNLNYGEDKIKKFFYKNLEFNLIPGWRMINNQNDVNTFLTTKTLLTIKSEKTLKINSIIKIYREVQKLFSFICYRQHVEFDSIILNQIEPIKFGDNIRDTIISFELHISADDDKYDLPKVGKTMILKDYVGRIPKLIQCLCDDEFMLLSFPSNSLTESIIDNNKYISISSAFESEFNLLNPKFKSFRKKKYSEAKIATLNYLINQKDNVEKYNRQTRNYFEDLYKFIDDCEGRLEEKIMYALETYSYIVEPERGFFINKNPDIDFSNCSLAKAFTDKRNNLSHGSKLEKFKKIEIASYSIIRKINYAMILERAGFNKIQIREIIKQVL